MHMPIDSVALTSHQRNLFFAAHENSYSKPQLVKMQERTDHGVPIPNLYIYNKTSMLKSQRTMQNDMWKDCKS